MLQWNSILKSQFDDYNLILAEMEATFPIKRSRRSQDKPWWNTFLKRARFLKESG